MRELFCCVCVMFCIIVFERYLEHRYMKTERYKKSLGGANELKTVPSDIEICNIGSGAGMHGISYDGCSKSGFNFSTSPQSLKYGFRILKRFKNHIQPEAIIVIILCAFSFGNNLDCNNAGYGDKFYGILPSKEIDDYSSLRNIMLKFPLAISVASKIKHSFLGGAYDKKNNKAELGVIQIWKREFQLFDLENSAQSENHKASFDEKVKILCEGIKFCESKEWKPILVFPPMPEGIRKYIGDEFINKFFYDNISRVKTMNPEIKIYDYYDDNRFTSGMFNDSVFLNEMGRNKFSEILLGDVEKI